MSSSEDIATLRQLKESQPLQNAWDSWIQTRQVALSPLSRIPVPEGTCLVALGRNRPSP